MNLQHDSSYGTMNCEYLLLVDIKCGLFGTSQVHIRLDITTPLQFECATALYVAKLSGWTLCYFYRDMSHKILSRSIVEISTRKLLGTTHPEVFAERL